MRTISVVEQGARVCAKRNFFIVEREGKELRRIRAHEIGQLLLFGNILFTPGALALAARKKIDVVFLTQHGNFRARLLTRESKNIILRGQQWERAQQPQFAARMAARFIKGKLVNQRHLLLRAQRQLKHPELADALGRLRLIIRDLERADQVETLRGLEGAGTAIYFQQFGKLIKNPAFSFSGRNRRPPRDPVNAALSFGYKLLQTTIENIVLQCGLDLFRGFLHQPHYGHPALALDLMEEFRPMVDQLVLRLINRRQLGPADFHNPDSPSPEALLNAPEPPPFPSDDKQPPPVHLSQTGRKIFVAAFHQKLRTTMINPNTGQRRTLRDIIQDQCYLLAQAIEEGWEHYEPFMWT